MPQNQCAWCQRALHAIERHTEKNVCETPKDLIVLYKHLRTVLWKLLKMPYGISGAGCQWAKVIDGWLMEFGLVKVMGMNQLYIKYFKNGNIDLIIAKVTNDMLVTGSVEATTKVRDAMHDHLQLSKSVIDKPVIYNGCSICQTKTGDNKMSMYECMTRILYVYMSYSRRKSQQVKAKDTEIAPYRKIAGSSMLLGKGVLPPARLAGCILQQKIRNICVEHLVTAKEILSEIN